MRILKRIAISCFFGNRFFRKGIRFGKDSFVHKHAQIIGGNHIVLGDHSKIGVYSRLCCWKEIAGVVFSPQIKIGDNVFIGRNVTISCAKNVSIGDNTAIAGYVFICDSNHGTDPESDLRYEVQPLEVKEVSIGNNCFIGDKAIILPGVKIGDNSIVGAGSVVTKSFESGSMIVGNPARCIKKYSYENHCWERQ